MSKKYKQFISNKGKIYIGVGITAAILFLVLLINLPIQGTNSKEVLFEIKEGASLSQIALDLKKSNLVQSATLFKWVSLLTGKDKRFRSGQYLIKGKVSLAKLIGLFEQGKIILLQFTIPEGLRMKEIFAKIRAAGLANTSKYEVLSTDQTFIKTLGIPIPVTTLEGFLFPETYMFSKNSSEKVVLRKMVRTFFQNLPMDFKTRASKLNLSFYDAITLASIIEKETGKNSERKLISSVFHNRLRIKMPLQTDPTVIYGIKNFNGNLTRKHLRTKTPYNTYIISGFPPTPISNPGIDSLAAAISPIKSDYLFFVGTGEGKHKFSAEYKDHKKAVVKYQRKRRKNYRSY